MPGRSEPSSERALAQPSVRPGTAVWDDEKVEYEPPEESMEPGSDDSPSRRIAVAHEAGLHMQQLVKLGQWEEATEGWAALLARYRDDHQLACQVMVGWSGAVAATLFLEQKEPKLAVALADDVIATFRTSDEPRLRAAVAIAMQTRALAFGKGNEFSAQPARAPNWRPTSAQIPTRR
jgi:hypothetical protein